MLVTVLTCSHSEGEGGVNQVACSQGFVALRSKVKKLYVLDSIKLALNRNDCCSLLLQSGRAFSTKLHFTCQG